MLRFPFKLPPVPAEVVRAFVAACAGEGVARFSQAFRLIDSEGLSFHRVRAALPDQVLRIIRQTFAARRQAKIEAPKWLRELQGQIKQTQWQIRRVLAPEGARGRRLKRLADLTYRASGLPGDRFYLPALGGTYSTKWCNLQRGSANSLNAGCKGEACDGAMARTVNLEGDGL